MSNVRRGEPERESSSSAIAEHCGARIRSAMASLGWVDSSGEADVARLKRAIEDATGGTVRWQTVQYWVLGRSVPTGERAAALARVLGMTLDELLGVAAGQDPPFAAWREFLASPEGQSMTPGERRTLQAIAWPPGTEPTTAAYAVVLAGVRLTRPRKS